MKSIKINQNFISVNFLVCWKLANQLLLNSVFCINTKNYSVQSLLSVELFENNKKFRFNQTEMFDKQEYFCIRTNNQKLK